MYSYKEIKQFALDFDKVTATKEQKKQLREIVDQLGLPYRDCHCKNLDGILYQKLASWLKNHTELCHYQMVAGVILSLKDGGFACKANLTDAMAKELLETEEGKKYIFPILAEEVENDDTEDKTDEPETVIVTEDESAESESEQVTITEDKTDEPEQAIITEDEIAIIEKKAEMPVTKRRISSKNK